MLASITIAPGIQVSWTLKCLQKPIDYQIVMSITYYLLKFIFISNLALREAEKSSYA